MTFLLAFVAGFFAGNGTPYYVAGSIGIGTNPSPFPKTPTANVFIGVLMLALAGLCWHFVKTDEAPFLAYPGACAGVLAVGLIHGRLWNKDPWGTGKNPESGTHNLE